MNPFTPILDQFDYARKQELIRIGYLDQNGNEFQDPYLREEAHEKLPRSIFSFRNDDIRARHIEDAQPIWENIWFENECACLFGDPNIGKSTLAFDIAMNIARNGRNVLYVDFENMMHNYNSKNWNGLNTMTPENLFVMHYSQNSSFDEMTDRKTILKSIEADFLDLNTPVIIIDDITHICPMRNCNKTQKVLRKLKQWQNKYHVSILVIAHATHHQEGTPLSLKHLTGDRQLAFAFDSIFTLNDIPARMTANHATHYIKQLKARNAPIQFNHKSVMTLRLETHYNDEECDVIVERNLERGLSQEFIDQCMEDIRGRKHFHFFFLEKDVNELQILFLPQDATREQQLEFIHDTFSKGWSIRNIAAHTGISKSTIHRLLATTREQLDNDESKQEQQEEKKQQKEAEKKVELEEYKIEEEEKEEVSNRTKKTKKEDDKKKKNKKHKKRRKS